jgi:hypothetical protein
MTGRSSEGDRRGKAGRRVHFEAMVAVGGAEGGAAFDAESVDVSGEGMRLRTAYLPAIGDQLVCRFEAEDGEICAVGEVIWASEESRGGEFGLRFVDLDDETRDALAALCKVHGEGDPIEIAPSVVKNARVKLHIEGLASPMKARVRDSDPKTASVGSSLEFLKLGRPVQVEDVDAGDRREGIVDGVKVEVDPKTSIPQLVVSLRFDGGMPATASAPAPAKIVEEKAPDTVVAAREKPVEKPKPTPKVEVSAKVEASEAEESEFDDAELGLPKNRGEQVKNAAKELSTKAKSTLDMVGQGASGFFARMRDAVAERRAARAKEAKANAPKRVTAPPPSGALTSAGRRVVRQDKDAESDDPVVTPVRSKKPLYIGAGVGLALLLGGGILAAGGSSKKEAAAPKPAVTAEQKPQPALPPIPGAPAVADVPLYGATPLSTTEQVLPAEAEATAPSPKASEPAESDEGEEKSELVKEFGQGSVKNAKILKVRLDGPVSGFTAIENDDGFTLLVPKRKSTSTSSALVRKDKRLAAVDVVNKDDEAEITVKFKGDVPGYKAKVRGDRIEIALSSEAGGAAPKKVAAKKPDAKKGTSKKGDKKAPSKKPAPKQED